ncbi:MAG TPA: hypothetical protein PKD84_08220 [Propionicimonas sp.]|nr:hypothetical protein [Propionicimonas sp.]
MNPALAVALKAVAIAVAALIAVLPGSPVVTTVLSRAGATAPESTDADHLRGGRWIGRLERLAVYASLLAGFPEGIAVVLAVKSLARYPELRATDSATAEKFIIGTLTSVLYSAAVAGLTLWLISLW